jgi:hypothetical protein
MGVRPRRQRVDINGALKMTSVGKKGGFIKGQRRMHVIRVGTLDKTGLTEKILDIIK